MQKLPYRDRSLGIDARVRDLVGRMTLEEKLRQMVMVGFNWERPELAGNASGLLKRELGALGVGWIQDARFSAPSARARVLNAVQRYLMEHTRLGIPAMVAGECLHGHMARGATIFPQAIGMASTWNPRLVARVAGIAAFEGRAAGVAQAFAPDLDLARDPRWGRVEETYGEDPYLVSRMGVAYIRAMQGSKRPLDRRHMVCTAKHFAAHGSPEGGINLAPVASGMREVRSVYLPPFEAAVREGDVLSVMPAYSELDGVPASSSRWLLTELLRDEWHFRGCVFSDYGAVRMLERFHCVAASASEAGTMALKAGMDVEAPGAYGFGDRLLELVSQNKVPIAMVDRAVERILRTKMLAGLFENPYADMSGVKKINCPAHRRAALEVAREAIILLKNANGILPLDRNLDSIAVIGPNADVCQYGDYSWTKTDGVTPLQGIRAAVSRKTKITHARGCGIHETSRAGIAEAVATAGASSVAVVVVGDCSNLTGGIGWGVDRSVATCGEGYDRTELTLPGVQGEMVKAVCATGTPVVLVLVHGRPVVEPELFEGVAAILDAWYPGEQGGNALADIIFGKVSPSGRLPVSIPRSVGHVPAFYNHKPSARGYYHKPGSPEAPGRDYVFSPPTPLFEFGFGLSYTRFKYSNLRVSPRRIIPGSAVEVSVDVENVGKRAGGEVVQVYLRDLVSSVTTPVKSLVGFKKVFLRPGRKQTVFFRVPAEAMKLLDADMRRVVEPGQFEVRIDSLKKTFDVMQT